MARKKNQTINCNLQHLEKIELEFVDLKKTMREPRYEIGLEWGAGHVTIRAQRPGLEVNFDPLLYSLQDLFLIN